jgi:hypothetical protein
MTLTNYLHFDALNLILAITNLPAVYPFYISVQKSNYFLAAVISASFFSSFFYTTWD